jgi:hypothetical protein
MSPRGSIGVSLPVTTTSVVIAWTDEPRLVYTDINNRVTARKEEKEDTSSQYLLISRKFVGL